MSSSSGNLLSGLLRGVLKVVLVMFGLVFGLSLLVAAIIMLVFSQLKYLITGKKSTAAMVFQRFREFKSGGAWPTAAPGAAKPGHQGDVVDVQAREIPSRPHDRS